LQANATTEAVSVGFASGSAVQSPALVTAGTEPYLGKSQDDITAGTIHVNLVGTTNINAISDGTATATAQGANFGLAAIALLHPSATVNGKTRDYIGPDT